jgi:protein O-GlcNAc transferase
MAGRLLACLLSAVLALAQTADQAFQRGVKLFAEGRLDAAMASFREAVRAKPDHAPAWKGIGVLLASQGDVEGAETPFRNACEIQPALADACLYYGRTLYLLNRFPQAAEILRGVVRREPRSGEAYRLLGLSLEGMGDTAAAGDAFRQALRGIPSNAANEDPGIDYGVFLFRQGRAEESVEPLREALKRHPAAARAYLELGCVQLSLDRVSEAAASLERSVALDEGNARAHLLLGKAYLRLGKNEAAEVQLRQGSRTVR